MPRDPEVDRQLFGDLQTLVMQRDQLRHQFSNLVNQLSARRQGTQTAQELYNAFINMDFQLIRGLSSSANAARDRRGVRHQSHKKRQTEETSTEMRFYEDWNRSLAMQQGIASIPQSLDQFEADEQAIVVRLADTQDSIAQYDKQIADLQTWLDFMLDEYLESHHFNFPGGNDGDDDEGGYLGTLDTGEVVN